MEEKSPQEETSLNPFASPAVATAEFIPRIDPELEIAEFNLGKSLLKWMLVCGISGAPSFFVAMSLGNQFAIQALAMLSGILTYVVLYVFTESRESIRRKLTNRSLRLAVRIGYGTRVAISILFPVALYLDMMCGMFSVALMSGLFGQGFAAVGVAENGSVNLLLIFAYFYLTTLLQGLILNLILGGYTLVVYAIVALTRSGSRNRP